MILITVTFRKFFSGAEFLLFLSSEAGNILGFHKLVKMGLLPLTEGPNSKALKKSIKKYFKEPSSVVVFRIKLWRK